MASLLWNGAEGLNMYLMLVKVFESHIRHFTLKAALIAWGMNQKYKQTNTQKKENNQQIEKDNIAFMQSISYVSWHIQNVFVFVWDLKFLRFEILKSDLYDTRTYLKLVISL